MNIQESPEPLKPTILIVDDDPMDRQLLSVIVSQFGYNCDVADSGTEAIRKVKSINPNMVLVDVFMPGMNGVEVCRQLKSHDDTRFIPVISLASSTDRDVRIECLEAGANDFITKPSSLTSIDLTELRIKLRNLFQLSEFEKIKAKHAVLTKTMSAIETAKREWEQSIDCIRDVVILVDAEGLILRCNKTFNTLTGKTFEEIIGRHWEEVMSDGQFSSKSHSEQSEFFHKSGKWFKRSVYHVESDSESFAPDSVITLQDITESKKMTEILKCNQKMLEKKNAELAKAYENIKMSQSQILQQEKMASIGQLAAGVAHEINNPIGFITSNLNTLTRYIGKISEFVKEQSAFAEKYKKGFAAADDVDGIEKKRQSLKIDYIMEDIGTLIGESLDGAERVKRIVQDLKNFSRTDETEYKIADINAGIESTINIIWNELKYKASLTKEFGNIPHTKCNPGQLNQVFMNLLMNAVQSIEKQGEIKVRTWHENNLIKIAVSDTGSGIPPEKLGRIFEPFFTTKEVGKGTGLGLSIVYDIIKKHDGNIAVDSAVGKGTTFTVSIPIVEL